MSRPPIGGLLIIFVTSLIYWGTIMWVKVIAPYDPIDTEAFLIGIILVLNLVLLVVLRFRLFFRDLLFRLKIITRNRRYLYIVVLALFQMIIASICYLSYRSNPTLYVQGEEIEKRHMELTLERTKSDSIFIKKFDDLFSEEIKSLDFFLNNKDSFPKAAMVVFLSATA